MGKINIIIETEYEVGDVVVFEKDDTLMVGIIEGYYVDQSANNSLWFNIRTNPDNVFTYSNGGDVAEFDIVGKLSEKIQKEVYKLIKEEM